MAPALGWRWWPRSSATMAGCIDCDSRPGRTRFRILLPVASGAFVPDHRRGPGQMSHTVLLADDDAAIRMVLNQALTRAGYEVRPTGNLSTMWNWVSRGRGRPPDHRRGHARRQCLRHHAQDQEAAARSADDRDERAEHLHDRDPRQRSRRLRIPAQALRHHRGALGGGARPGRRQEADRPPNARPKSRARPCRWSAARPPCRTSTARWRG